MATLDLPVPPERLRIWVGPFSDAELFVRSGEQTLNEIVGLCGLPADSRVLEIGCGCGVECGAGAVVAAGGAGIS